MNSRIVAIVPMRHHSERVPGKNFRPCARRPLYHHIIETLLACPSIDRVAIDTDSEFIMDDARKNFPQVQLIERPHHLREGTISMNDVLLHSVTQAIGSYYLQTHSTNPLLRAETISRAIQLFLDSYPAYDSLFSATRFQARLWDHRTRPINHNPEILARTQDLLPVYEENSSIYIFPREVIEKRRNRIGERPMMMEIDRMEAWDIDEELDFRIAEFFLLERNKKTLQG